jgi:23S rRNA (cytidine1920-2'-O)/16S rRNA (cytidine1409-2'-O)-methyltransferase
MTREQSKRMRLDQMLVVRRLAPTRSRARDMIARGCVTVDGAIIRKSGRSIFEHAAIAVAGEANPYVSRGGLKLAAALAAFGFDPAGRTALDVGASTGGFTDVLLKAGASRVYAVDVGRDQLHPTLKADPRVVSLESTDARTLSREQIPEVIHAVVADVSFISATKLLPVPLSFAVSGAWLVLLVKPQFEAGRRAVGKGGIVRNPVARQKSVAEVRAWLAAQPGWFVVGAIPSPVAGASGNEEFLLGAIKYG